MTMDELSDLLDQLYSTREGTYMGDIKAKILVEFARLYETEYMYNSVSK